jgi:hypothetical protein
LIPRRFNGISRDVSAALAHSAGASDVAPECRRRQNDGAITSFKGGIMQQRTIKVNASEETIKIGPLGGRLVWFRLTVQRADYG